MNLPLKEKLSKLKSFYTLKEAAERISSDFEGESISEHDLLDLAYEGYVTLSTILRNQKCNEINLKTLSEVAPSPQALSGFRGSSDPLLREIGSNTLDLEQFILSGDLINEPLSELVKIPFNVMDQLDQDYVKDWYFSLSKKTDTAYSSEGGFIYLRRDGTFLMPVERIPNSNGYMPMYIAPKISELFIEPDELDRLIGLLSEDAEGNSKSSLNLRTPIESYLKSMGILALMVSKQRSSLAIGERANAKRIAEEVINRAKELGIEIENPSNLNKDISLAVKGLNS